MVVRCLPQRRGRDLSEGGDQRRRDILLILTSGSVFEDVRERDDPFSPVFTVRQEERRRWMLKTMAKMSDRIAMELNKER